MITQYAPCPACGGKPASPGTHNLHCCSKCNGAGKIPVAEADALGVIASRLGMVLESGILGYGKHQVLTEEGIVRTVEALVEFALDRRQTCVLKVQITPTDVIRRSIDVLAEAISEEPDTAELADIFDLRWEIARRLGVDGLVDAKSMVIAALQVRARRIREAVRVDESSTEHDLKVWPAFYSSLADGTKNHELREKRDREFRVGDVLRLREWAPTHGEDGQYTGRFVRRQITYIYEGDGSWGLAPGHVIMSLGPAL